MLFQLGTLVSFFVGGRIRLVHWGLRWVLNKNDVKLGPEVGDVYFRFRDVIENTHGENFYDYSHGEMLVLCFFPDTSIRSLQIFWILQRIFITWFRGVFSYPIFVDHLLKALKNFYVLYITMAVIFPWLGRCRGWKNPQEEGKVREESFTRKVCQDKN